MTAFNQAWDILKCALEIFKVKQRMQDDIKHRYAKEKGNPRMMPSHEQDTVNEGMVNRLVHDKMQENMQQGRVGEQTTDAQQVIALFVPGFDARAIHPKFTVRQDIQDKMPYSMSVAAH